MLQAKISAPPQTPPAKWRRLVGPGIASLILLAALLSLGVWQSHRLIWKEAILARIHQAELAPPVPLPAHPQPFEKVGVVGTWIADKAALYGDEVENSPAGPQRGGQLLMPLQRPDGSVLLVDLGWVPESTPVPYTVPAGLIEVSGYIAQPQKPGFFAGQDNPAQHIFYTRNPQKIGASLGLKHVENFVLVTLGPKPLSGWPDPAHNLPTPPNNHYQYELTWFGLAVVLVIEFIFYARKRLIED